MKQSIKSFALIKRGRIFHQPNRSKSTIPSKLYIGFYTHRVTVIRSSKHSNVLSTYTMQQRHFSRDVPNHTPKPTDTQIINFHAEMDRLFDEYEANDSYDSISVSDKTTECEKCKIVIENVLEPFTHKLLPNHPNIKCYVSILDEKALLLTISKLTGVSSINLEQYFRALSHDKINEKDATQFDDSCQYNGQISYCRVSPIASNLC
eukprot:UN06774